MKDSRIRLEVLKDYYGEEPLEWILVDKDEKMSDLDINFSFISVILNDRAEILSYISYLRHEKLMSIIK